jgi:hypothetical protein
MNKQPVAGLRVCDDCGKRKRYFSGETMPKGWRRGRDAYGDFYLCEQCVLGDGERDVYWIPSVSGYDIAVGADGMAIASKEEPPVKDEPSAAGGECPRCGRAIDGVNVRASSFYGVCADCYRERRV